MPELKTVRMGEDVDALRVIATFSSPTDLSSVPCAFGMRKRGSETRELDWVAAQKEDVTDEAAGETAQTKWRLYYDFAEDQVGDFEGLYLARFRLDFGGGEVRYYPDDSMISVSFRKGV